MREPESKERLSAKKVPDTYEVAHEFMSQFTPEEISRWDTHQNALFKEHLASGKGSFIHKLAAKPLPRPETKEERHAQELIKQSLPDLDDLAEHAGYEPGDFWDGLFEEDQILIEVMGPVKTEEASAAIRSRANIASYLKLAQIIEA